MTDNTNTEAMHEPRCDCKKCRGKASLKLVRHVSHSLGKEVDDAALYAIARTLFNAGFYIEGIGTKAERDYAKRERELVVRLRREREQRIHDHVKALLGKIAAEMPDGGIRVFIDDAELSDNHVFIYVRGGELINPDDERAGGPFPAPDFYPDEPPTSEIAF